MPAISKTAMAAQTAEQIAREQELRKRAARQAAAKLKEPEVVVLAECRVLPKGDGKVSMGEHVAGIGEVYFERGEMFTTRRERAQELEDDGYVEITKVIEPPKAPEAA